MEMPAGHGARQRRIVRADIVASIAAGATARAEATVAIPRPPLLAPPPLAPSPAALSPAQPSSAADTETPSLQPLSLSPASFACPPMAPPSGVTLAAPRFSPPSNLPLRPAMPAASLPSPVPPGRHPLPASAPNVPLVRSLIPPVTAPAIDAGAVRRDSPPGVARKRAAQERKFLGHCNFTV